MLKRILRFLSSMELMGVITLIFAFSIGFATIIERDSGTEAAKVLVYNHTWFNVLLFLGAVNLIGSLINYRMFTKRKFTVTLFHLGFVFILLGAGVTRFIGFEGSMNLREGEQRNTFLSAKTYVDINIKEADEDYHFSKQVRYTPSTSVSFSHNVSLSSDYEIELVDYIPNAVETIQKDDKGVPMMRVAISDFISRKDVILQDKEALLLHGQQFVLNGVEPDTMAIKYTTRDGKLFMTSPFPIVIIQMMSGLGDTIPNNTMVEFKTGQIYESGQVRMVLVDYYDAGSIAYTSVSDPTVNNNDVFNFLVRSGNQSRNLLIAGKNGVGMMPGTVKVNNATVSIAYGAKTLELPFEIRLEDFVMERYPGSESPSSYLSKVKVVDGADKFDYEIYMNHILNHKGYRFYQASYDTDEKGTTLTVNHDEWGTIVTYLGYFLMSLGMLLSIFSRGSRFRALYHRALKLGEDRKSIRTVLLLMLFGLGSVSGSFAQDNANIKTYPDAAHAEKFGMLWVQDPQGRFEPLNTLSSEVVRKLCRKEKFHGLTHQQVFLGVMADPVSWANVKLLRVGHKEIMKYLGQEGKYVSYIDLLDTVTKSYRLRSEVEDAYAKQPGKRTTFDKEVMKVYERMNIFYSLVRGQYVRFFPTPNDSTQGWSTGFEYINKIKGEDSLFVKNIVPMYLQAVREGISSSDWTTAEEYLKAIGDYQSKYGQSVLPGEKLKQLETFYNESDIFDRVGRVYLIAGILLLIVLFIGVLRPGKEFKWVRRILSALLIVAFLFHTYGLGLRWYISGHAPWSNGYESMIYIAWATFLAGLVFSRRALISLAATSVLASMALMVAHLTYMDPEITNLVPVLKSYWLTIHVSVITASYGFLGLGAILALFNLLVYLFLNEKNKIRLHTVIEHISIINEMTLTVGLYMLTIGTFLGAIWANESWGRYWGWDPKETWSLVTILVYSFVTHMRMIPGLNSRFVFNLLTLLSYGSVLMTYFGVNYLLAGLHSYAKGEPAPMPMYVWYTLIVILVIALFAAFKNKKHQ